MGSVGEAELRFEGLVGARDVLEEAPQPLAGPDGQSLNVQRAPVPEERQLHRVLVLGGVVELDQDLALALVEGVAAHGKGADRDVARGLADLGEGQAHAAVRKPLHHPRRRFDAPVADHHHLGPRLVAEHVEGEAQPAPPDRPRRPPLRSRSATLRGRVGRRTAGSPAWWWRPSARRSSGLRGPGPRSARGRAHGRPRCGCRLRYRWPAWRRWRRRAARWCDPRRWRLRSAGRRGRRRGRRRWRGRSGARGSA